ncbi:hypothetical protein P154DRAFT_531630 [Amniculicola lignicola CBS 123094]|uniref:Uncharacterized protein n=1 Tax=Amniculicola lignicola CBS 123094 TaxID=1392246 RepID=A0A6A5WTC8_9PLEO|nr:hypothetical protein P154DRAFT_531630 [Amniculicola lignicola CBS 123094]
MEDDSAVVKVSLNGFDHNDHPGSATTYPLTSGESFIPRMLHTNRLSSQVKERTDYANESSIYERFSALLWPFSSSTPPSITTYQTKGNGGHSVSKATKDGTSKRKRKNDDDEVTEDTATPAKATKKAKARLDLPFDESSIQDTMKFKTPEPNSAPKGKKSVFSALEKGYAISKSSTPTKNEPLSETADREGYTQGTLTEDDNSQELADKTEAGADVNKASKARQTNTALSDK